MLPAAVAASEHTHAVLQFDVRRKLTVLELVRISRSSADQRMGRAGRITEVRVFCLPADQKLGALRATVRGC